MNQGSSQTAPSTTRLLWAVHSHQPVGNFDFVFENAFRNAYGPFVDVLERHPSIGVDFHFSGILLDWLDKNRPEFLERVAALVRRGQCGLLAGAYHEPILPPIPRHDQVGQVRALADRLEKRFGVRPRGMVDRSAPVIDRVVVRADKATEDLPAIVADLKATSSDIRTILAKARSGESTLGKLANDDAFYKEISGAVVRADSLLNRIQRRGLDVNVDLW